MNGDAEKKLISAVLESALSDMQVLNESFEGVRAAEFIMGNRSNHFFSLLDLDPKEMRKRLYEYANKDTCGELAETAKSRRAMRINIDEAMRIYGLGIPD